MYSAQTGGTWSPSLRKKPPATGESQSWLLPVYNATLVFDEATRQGVDRYDLIRGTGFSLKDFRNSDTLKSYDQVVALIERALKLCPLPGLGLRIGRDESPTQWGILGYAMMCCRTLRDMMTMLIKYHRIAASMAEFYFSEENVLARLEVRPPWALREALPTIVEEHFSSTLSAARILTGRKEIRPIEVNLSYAAPPYARMYRECFGCPVHFSQPSNTLLLDNKWLESPIMHSSSISSHMAERICELQLRRQYIEHDIVHRVRYLLLKCTDTFPDAEAIAQILHMTSRTLRNRLREQGTSFQSILDDVRQQLAVNYLASTLSLADISALVGFNDVSNFRRAFKKWTGKNPSEFRCTRT
jgi:AraC-like DNA-binding protein